MIKLNANSVKQANEIVKANYPGMRVHVAGNENPIAYYAVTQAEWDVLHPANTDRRLDYDEFRDKWPSNNKWWDTWEFARTNAAAWKFMIRLAIEERGVILNSNRVAEFLQLLVDNNVLTNNQRNNILNGQ
jgi:hypothetical protein